MNIEKKLPCNCGLALLNSRSLIARSNAKFSGQILNPAGSYHRQKFFVRNSIVSGNVHRIKSFCFSTQLIYSR